MCDTIRDYVGNDAKFVKRNIKLKLTMRFLDAKLCRKLA